MDINNYETIKFLNNKFLNLYKFFNIIYNDDDNNNTSDNFDILCIMHALKLLYDGIRGNNSRKNIKSQTHLEDILKYLPDPMRMRIAIFIRQGYNFNKKYRRKNHRALLESFIPTDIMRVNKINDLMDKKFPGWSEKFITHPVFDDCRLYIKNQTYFEGYWEVGFDVEKTKLRSFYCGDNKVINIPMMIKTGREEILTYNTNHVKFVSLPYNKENGYSMLIIMPEKPCNKEELVNFCINELTGDDITNFYYSKGVKVTYGEKIMPKFKIITNWELSSEDECYFNPRANRFAPFMELMFNKNIRLQNIDENMASDNTLVKMRSSSEIINEEKGTIIKSEVEIYECDDEDKTTVFPSYSSLIINKSFIWAVVNEDNVVTNIGTFVG